MTDKYTALRNAIAAGPTPGPWKAAIGTGYDYGSNSYGVSAPTPNYWIVPTLNIKQANTEYIAAADPETIRALLAERDALREALVIAREYVADEIAYLKNAFRGHEELGRVPEAEADLARIDAALGDANV